MRNSFELFPLCKTLHHIHHNAAGTENDTQSSSNSTRQWIGSITLTAGTHNITIEYHNGDGGGALIMRAGYGTATASSGVSMC